MEKSKPPAWIRRYEEDFRKRRITPEEIFKRENAEREAKQLPQLKFRSVERAINACGLSYTLYKSVQKQEPKPSEVPPSSSPKPCFGCKYYTKKYICIYPRSMFNIYPELFDFDKDFAKGVCKLREIKEK